MKVSGLPGLGNKTSQLLLNPALNCVQPANQKKKK